MTRLPDASALFANASALPRRVVTHDDLESLPPPVRRCLLHAGVVGKAVPSTVRLRQRGRMRREPNGGWYPLEAEQYYTTHQPGFLWLGRMRLLPFWKVTARDALLGGSASMTVWLLPFVKVVDATGPEVYRSDLVRYLSEMIWFPAAFVLPHVSWEPIDDSSARATLNDGDTSVCGVFHMSPEGAITRFVAERGYTTGQASVPTVWSTPITRYAEMAGLCLPAAGGAVWHLTEGDFAYIEVEVTTLEYDEWRPF